MKHTLTILLFTLPFWALAQYPANPSKMRQGIQTTASGLTYVTDSIPDWTPASYRDDTYTALDTVAGVLYCWNGTAAAWEACSGGGGGVSYSDSLTVFVTPTQLSDSLATVALDTTTCTLADSTTIVWDVATCPVAQVTLGGNRTLQVDNPATNGIYILTVTQDATGSRTLNWPGTFTWQGGTAGVLSTTASSVDELTIRAVSGSQRAILTKDWQ